MTTNDSGDAMEARPVRDRRIILSAAWIVATLSYIYADVFTLFFDREALDAAADMSSGVVFAFAVMMWTAIAMVFVARVLPWGPNRWANVGIGALHTAMVAFSLTEGAPPFYAFFAAAEIAVTLFIIRFAWTWKPRAAARRAQTEGIDGAGGAAAR